MELIELQSTIDDVLWDQRNIQSIQRAEAIALVERVAIGHALMSHPITRYVRRCPFESASRYPAISGSYVSLSKALLGRSPRVGSDRNADRTDDLPNMYWSLPGQDSSHKSSNCGVFRTNGSKDVPLKMCLSDPKDYMKAVGSHCGSLRCRNCMNYAAMNAGVRIEDRIMTPVDISGRKTGSWDSPKHWAISPPQEWMKRIAQRSDHFSGLVDDLVKLLPEYGFYCGAIVFHPWRLSDDSSRWLFSPHFHAVGYGRFDNMRLRRDLAAVDSELRLWDDDGSSSSWVFNQIHAGEEMRSIRHTLGYIMTHVGIGSFDHSVDWDREADDLLIPIEPGNGTKRVAKTIPTDAYEADWRSTGLYAEHFDQVDWLRWTEERVTGQVPTYRIFGSANDVRVVDRYREKVVRTCPVCGEAIGFFHSIRDHNPVPVEYLRNSTIRCMKEDKVLVEEYWDHKGESFLDAGYTKLDFAMSVPQCSTPETKGTQTLESNETVDQRRDRRDRCLVYVPSASGQGLDPVVVTRDEARRMRAAGIIV